MQIRNCIALVTGANRGLGKAYVEALLAAGAAKVYAGARNANDISQTDERVVAIKLDVTSQADIDAAAARCTDLNVLINNAGIMHETKLLEGDAIDLLRKELEVNAIGLLRVSQAFAPVLKKNGGGAIANMLSVVSWFVYPYNATYCVSKHAALGVTDGLRTQLKSQGTHVTAVYAGFIDTDMAAKADVPKTTPRQVAEKTLAGIENTLDHVHADEQSENYWKQLQQDRGLSKAMQDVWDSGVSAFAATRA
ncbi:MAG TPA: SDR family oxidoreductase [Planktothrix sp.]|jgi:NAD(P)-dependent dehydrogenase (short-subunit alcohol dehydrogenase family)